jgi:hypothetical protein
MPLPTVELVEKSFYDLEVGGKYIIVTTRRDFVDIYGDPFTQKVTLISKDDELDNYHFVTVLYDGEGQEPRRFRKESFTFYKINTIKNPNVMNVDGGSRRRRNRSRRSRRHR